MEIFVTNKLFEFIQINKLDSNQSENKKWSANIFILDRKKNIIITHKETLYSFIVTNLTKKDLGDLNEKIINELKIQLECDKIDVKNALNYFEISSTEDIFFLKTDNDRKTMGWTNDLLQVNKWLIEKNQQDKLASTVFFAHNEMNKRPVNSRRFLSPIEILKNKLGNKK